MLHPWHRAQSELHPCIPPASAVGPGTGDCSVFPKSGCSVSREMGVSFLALLPAAAPEWQVGSQSPSLAGETQRSFRPQNVQGLKCSWGKKRMFPYRGKKKDKIQQISLAPPCILSGADLRSWRKAERREKSQLRRFCVVCPGGGSPSRGPCLAVGSLPAPPSSKTLVL